MSEVYVINEQVITKKELFYLLLRKPDVPGFIPSIGDVETVTTSLAVSVLLIARLPLVVPPPPPPPREGKMVSWLFTCDI